MYGAYKFLDAEHVDSMMSGRIRLGSLDSYRKVEDPSIRDEFEGRQVLFQSQTIRVQQGLSVNPYRSNLIKVGIGTNGPVNLIASGNQAIRSAPRMHIFCYSEGLLDDLASYWSGRTGCIQLLDPDKLMRTMLDYGRVTVSAQETGTKPIFTHVERGPVMYDAAPVDFSKTWIPPASGFKKRREFAAEKESRFAFCNRFENLPDVIFLTIPNPSDHFVVIKR